MGISGDFNENSMGFMRDIRGFKGEFQGNLKGVFKEFPHTVTFELVMIM